jgi:hypothetical protein
VNHPASSIFNQLGRGGASVFLTAALALVPLAIIAAIWGRIFAKAGYPSWYGLVVFVPGANAVAAIYFAFAQWPIEREMRELTDRFGLNWRHPTQ